MSVEDNFVNRHDKFLRHLSASVEVAEPDFARVVAPLSDHHLNGMGAAHGGFISALADLAFGTASNAGRQEGVVSVSVNLQYLRPGLKGPLTAEARALRKGKHVLVYNVEIFDGDRELIAMGTFTGYATKIKLP